MSDHEHIIIHSQHESEMLLNELEVLRRSQEDYIRGMHHYIEANQTLPEGIKDQYEGLSTALKWRLTALADTLARQQRELTERGINIDRVWDPHKLHILAEKVREIEAQLRHLQGVYHEGAQQELAFQEIQNVYFQLDVIKATLQAGDHHPSPDIGPGPTPPTPLISPTHPEAIAKVAELRREWKAVQSRIAAIEDELKAANWIEQIQRGAAHLGELTALTAKKLELELRITTFGMESTN